MADKVTTPSCHICNKKVRKKQKYLKCEKCCYEYHIKCIRITPSQYNDMSTMGHAFMCGPCRKSYPITVNVKGSILNSLRSHLENDPNIPANEQNSGTRAYYDIDSLNSEISKANNQNLFIMHMNTHSLVKKVWDIDRMVDILVKPPDVICITETKLHNKNIDWQLGLVQIPHYNFFYDNSNTLAGGVGIYIRDCLTVDERNDLKLDVDECESVFLDINLKSNLTSFSGTQEKFTLGCAYRHPRTPKYQIEAFTDALENKLESVSTKNCPIFVTGDININMNNIDTDPQVQHFANMISSVGCEHLINSCTRFAKNSRSSLDQIITNCNDDISTAGILNTHISDHLPIFTIINLKDNCQLKDEPVRYIQKIVDSKKDEFLQHLGSQLAKINLENNPESIMEDLILCTQTSMDSIFPPKKATSKRRKQEDKPWISREIKKDMRDRDNFMAKFIETQDPADYELYRQRRNKVTKAKYKARQNFFRSDLDDAHGNSTKTWDVINKVFRKHKKRRVIPNFKISTSKSDSDTAENDSNSKETSDAEIAENDFNSKEASATEITENDSNSKEAFDAETSASAATISSTSVASDAKTAANIINAHFSKVGIDLAKKLKKSKVNFRKFLGSKNKKNIYLTKIEAHETAEEIFNLVINKSVGHDRIPPKIVKWASDLFVPILTLVFNKCIEQGIYPNCLKIAKVSPIHKSDDKNCVDNYRPISVLTQFNRVFERLISKRLASFFESCNIFSKCQFGFRKKHNTQQAILNLKEYITGNQENKEFTAILFLDLQKAFDTVDHTVLLAKLWHYGIRGIAYSLIESYLKNRFQYSVVGSDKSSLLEILCGVPQGSVLGPILFLIYINDLPRASSLFTWLFADDSALSASAKNLDDLEAEMNKGANLVQDWLLANKLSVHYVKKTQYMIIQPRRYAHKLESFKLFMGDKLIKRTSTYKYLGVIVDDKLRWEAEINEICKKMSKICGVISKTRYYLNRGSLMLIYHSLVSSILQCRTLCWGTASKSLLHKVDVLHNRIVRYILFKPRRTCLVSLYAESKILPLKDVFKLQIAKFMYCYHYNILPEIYNNFCTLVNHNYQTSIASSHNYILPFYGTAAGQKSIKYSGPKLWLDVPKEIKEVGYCKVFTKKYKIHLLDKITDASDKKSHKNCCLFKYDGNCTNEPDTLNAMFSDESDEGEFFGFEPSLDEIFNDTDSEEGDFSGFEPNLSEIFYETDIESDFFGF